MNEVHIHHPLSVIAQLSLCWALSASYLSPKFAGEAILWPSHRKRLAIFFKSLRCDEELSTCFRMGRDIFRDGQQIIKVRPSWLGKYSKWCHHYIMVMWSLVWHAVLIMQTLFGSVGWIWLICGKSIITPCQIIFLISELINCLWAIFSLSYSLCPLQSPKVNGPRHSMFSSVLNSMLKISMTWSLLKPGTFTTYNWGRICSVRELTKLVLWHVFNLVIFNCFRGKDVLPWATSSQDGLLCPPGREGRHAKQEAALLQNGGLCTSKGTAPPAYIYM